MPVLRVRGSEARGFHAGGMGGASLLGRSRSVVFRLCFARIPLVFRLYSCFTSQVIRARKLVRIRIVTEAGLNTDRADLAEVGRRFEEGCVFPQDHSV